MDTAVVWFRDDLRVIDNPTLTDAVARATTVVPLYVFDPRVDERTQHGIDRYSSHRVAFRTQSVRDLRESMRDRGGELFVRRGDPESVVPSVIATTDADAVFMQTKPATEEKQTERRVRAAVQDGVDIERRWTHTLYHPDDLPTPPDGIDDTFTPWRKSVEAQAGVREPITAPDRIETPALEPGTIPSPTARGYTGVPTDDRAVLDFEGGESAGMDRVETYLWDRDRLREYKQTRNGLLGADYSSKFSAWLANGCLSPRWIHAEIDRYERERVESEDTYWLRFELCWRDYFQFQFEKHGAEFFTQSGIRNVDKRWRRDRTAFERWARGETGVPFVDANMRELNRTGYMSNRGRQNVASFLADALGIDWRWGAAYFEQQLVDYDVASNWGNWAYQAGVGNDSRDNHFNVLSQARRYDDDATYVTTWLPELDGLPPMYAHRPWRMDDSEQAAHGVELGIDYPRPMIDIERRYETLG